MNGNGTSLPSRLKLAAVIPHRPKVGWVLALLLALAFATVITPILLVDAWLGSSVAVHPRQRAPVTVRVPHFAGLETPDAALSGGGIVVRRGEIPDRDRAAAAAAAQAAQPRGTAAFMTYFAIVLSLVGLYTHHLRRSHRGRLLRVQLVHLGLLAGSLLVLKLLLLLTPMSVLVVPVALAAVVPTLVFDRSVGLATGVVAAVLVSLLVPFDVGVVTVLVVQVATAGLLIPERSRARWRIALVGTVVGAVSAAVTYSIVHYLSSGTGPMAELAHPQTSSWVAAAVGGALAGAGVVLFTPLYQMLVGEITPAKLVQLEDLSHPLLRQIADKSPGTWQHSLAMANMAEIAANAIGANGRLVRVGAYFHDLGKSLQPKYFIENLEPGEASPHDRLAPEVSCDAIFAHVTEGIAVARRAKLPERIVDFMHMHHGDGVLEYFWAKAKDQGNPNHLTVEHFRYPGVPPQSRETAILAICDAVEAASRTLKKPDDHAVANLVQRIVYGKLHLGQLDESGLSMADLRKISDALRETIKHAHHGRIEYPWQRAEREAAQAAAASADNVTPVTAAIRPPPGEGAVAAAAQGTTTSRLIDEPRLDSLDVPRPMWGERPARLNSDADTKAIGLAAGSGPRPAGADEGLATAATARMSTDPPVEAAPEAAPPPPPAPAPAERPRTAPLAEEDVLHEAAAAAPSPSPSPPPPPPGRPPRARTPLELDGDDIEGQIDLSPGARPSTGGAILGPPPATRPARNDPPGRAATADEEDPAEVPLPPAATMLPPRGRGSTKPK